MCQRRAGPYTLMLFNRQTGKQVDFTSKELGVLQRDYTSVCGGAAVIDRQCFGDKMGVLGLRVAEPFTSRLFSSFDMDNDGVINFNDFVQYMDILRNGSLRSKSFLSFRMIDVQKRGFLTRRDFMTFLKDFLCAWSCITNIAISSDMIARSNQYANSVFGVDNSHRIDFEQYYRAVCSGYQFMAAFEFITGGDQDVRTSNRLATEEEIRKILVQLENLERLCGGGMNQLALVSPSSHGGFVPYGSASMYEREPQVVFNSYSLLNRTGSPSERLRTVQTRLAQLTAYIRQTQAQPLKLPTTYDHNILRLKNNTGLTAHNLQRKEGKMVFFGDSQWNLVLNMMIGVQTAVKSLGNQHETDDFKLKYYFELMPKRFGGDKQQNNNICRFMDYAPNTFHRIRRLFGISNQEFARSMGPDGLLASLVMGEMASMTSLSSQGKSGSFFFYSADGRYLLKSVKRQQFKYLREILQQYYEYVRRNPSTLITKFYGLHKLVERDSRGRTVRKHYLTIMGNVFDTEERIIEKYDLKGSTYGRMTPLHERNATKKDLNFMWRRPIELPLDIRTQLLTTLYYDSQFLYSLNALDYSLLVGVVHREGASKMSTQTTSTMINTDNPSTARPQKHYDSRTTNERYVFGVIDILTAYRFKKRLTSILERIVHGCGVSAIPPEDYARRFYAFMNNVVFR